MSCVRTRVCVRKKLANNNWESVENVIVVDDASGISVSTGIGKKKDTFEFRINNANNRCFHQYFSGTGAKQDFTLKYSPIPASYLGTDNFVVSVGGEQYAYVSDEPGTKQYTISGSTLSFGSPPSLGTKNIDVHFELFSVDDLVRIYRWTDNTWSGLGTSGQNSALLMEGTISEPSETINDSGNALLVRGVGMIEAVITGIVFLAQRTDSSGNPIDDVVAEPGSSGSGALQRVINYLNNQQSAARRRLVWASDNDSTTLPITYSSSYRPAIEIFEELTSNNYTGVGQMYYWVTYDADTDAFLFHLKKKNPDSSGTITEGTSNQTNIKVGLSVEDVINQITFYCGTDPAGHPIRYHNFRFTSSYAPRPKFVTSTSYIADQIVNEEFDKDRAEWDVTASNERTSTLPIDYANDWLDADGDWDFAFVKRNDNFSLTTDVYQDSAPGDPYYLTVGDAGYPAMVGQLVKASASTEAEWIKAIRDEAKGRGVEVTNSILDLYEQPRYKCEITLNASDFSSSTYVLGDFWKLTIPSFGLVEKVLHLVQIDHSFWETILYFEEDETTMEGGI